MTEIFKYMNKLYRNKYWFGGVLLGIAFILGITGNFLIYHDKWKSLTITLSYLGLNAPSDVNWLVGLSFLIIVAVLWLSVIIVFFRKKFDRRYAINLMKEENLIIFGYGEIAKTFLGKFNNDKNVVVVDVKDDKIDDEFWAKEYGFVKGDIKKDELFKIFNFEKTTDVLITLGDDRVNIDTALKIIEMLKNVSTPTKLILHIKNTKFIELFYKKFILKTDKNSLIDLKVFSFDVEVAENLFEKYPDFIPRKCINGFGDETFKIALIGNNGISLQIVNKILTNFIFPSNVKSELYLIDENEKQFFEKVKYEFNYTEEKFPHVDIKTEKLDFDLLKNKEFFEDMENIVITYEDEDKSLETVIDLYRNFLIRNKNENPKVYFCMFKEYKLSKKINENKDEFKRFFTFGNFEEIFTKENLFDDEKYDIAKRIHYGYGDVFDDEKLYENINEINKKWFDSALYSDKLSNIAQYEHLNIKLKSLGLEYKKSTLDKKELLEKNKKVFYEQIKSVMPFSLKELKDISNEVVKNWDGNGDVKKIEEFYNKILNSKEFYELINTEHKRWNAYHFANGWEKGEKDKSSKIHNCLVELDEIFPAKDTVIYDVYAYLYIPNLLAGSGYELIKCE